MRSSLLLALGAAGMAVAQTSATRVSALLLMADEFLASSFTPGDGYQAAVLYQGVQQAYELSQDAKYLDWLKSQIDGNVVKDDGTISGFNSSLYVLDLYRIGNNFLYLYNQTKDDKYKTAAKQIRLMYNSHPTSPKGGFWHSQYFPNQMWLDGLYMGEPFYAKWTSLFDTQNDTAWDQITLQYDLIETHARNTTSGLIPHGWADGTAPWADPGTGLAPHVWGRALGWYFMSLVEILQTVPQSNSKYDTLMGYYTSLADAVKSARSTAQGSWWEVMEDPYPGAEGNYVESSASAMFVYGTLKGISLGYLDRSTYLSDAKAAYHSLIHNFVSLDSSNSSLALNTTVDECNLAGAVDYEYYIDRPLITNGNNGVGPFMLASYEWETWARDA